MPVKSSSEPLVGIVTPVYNGADYLAECIESVLAQTYHNWEYTIVDNCSTDATWQIANEYAAREPRIRVQRNQSRLEVISNHNAALRLIPSGSKYCKMVFADDWMFPECIEKMVALAESHPSIGIVSSYCLEGTQVICTGLPYSKTVMSGLEIGREHLLNSLYLFGSANSLLYRADLVKARDPFYNEANIHADTEVCFALLKNCDFGFVHQILTFTRLRAGSENTVSASRQSYFAGMLHILLQHGTFYLSSMELKQYLDRLISKYYRFLGKSLLLRRDKNFWDYHTNQLSQLGVE